MKSQKLGFLFVLLLIVSLPIFCFAEYKVVIKKNGKVLEGKIVSDTDTSITIVSSGAQLTFKKADLDLEKMKELNADYHPKTEVKTIAIHKTAPQEQKKEASPLTDIAKMSEEARKQGQEETKQPADENEKAFLNHIVDLEERSKRIDVSQKQQQALLVEVVNTKKALSNYRSRNTHELSKEDQTFILEQLIKALEGELEEQKQLDPSDERIPGMRKNIQDKQDELSKLQR